MSSHEHHHCLEHAPAHSSVHQSIDELEFERGIWSAALDGDSAKVEQMISKDASWVNRQDAAGYTALHYGARAGHISVCKILLKYGATIDAVTKAGLATPLHRASASGKLEVCRLLVQGGADIKKLDGDGITALERARKNHHEDVVQLLNEHGAV